MKCRISPSALTVFVITAMVMWLIISSCERSTTAPGDSPPNLPDNPNPADGAVDQPVDASFTWTCTDPDGGELTYSVYLSVAPRDEPSLVSSGQSSSSYTPPEPLWYGTTYNWKIRAKDPDNNATTGPVWSFQTAALPDPEPPYEPVDPSPADGATNVDLSITLDWISSDPNGDAITYDVYFGTSSTPPLLQSNLTVPNLDLSGLSPEVTYYWQIVAHDETSVTAGPVWSFTTEALVGGHVAGFGSRPRWSPDGQKLAFGGDGSNSGIWVYYSTNSSLQQITDGLYPHNYDYRWSPSSDQIAFSGAGAAIDSTNGIFTVALDGSTPARRHPTGHSPTWSPDGAKLAFAENNSETATYGIHTINLASSSLEQLTSYGIEPQYSPNGSKIAFRVAGTAAVHALHVLTIANGGISVVSDSCLQIQWISDSQTLVFDLLSITGLQLYQVPAAGGSRTLILSGAGQPSVSNSGLIVFRKYNIDVALGIYTINIDGSNQVQRSQTGFQPNITPNGATIAYARDDGIWLIDL